MTAPNAVNDAFKALDVRKASFKASRPRARTAPDRNRTAGPARDGRRRRLTPYLLIAPTLLVIAVLLLWPMGQIVVMSLQKVGNRQLRGEPAEWVGTENYTAILADERFASSLLHTVLFAVVAVAATLVVGTLVGLLLNRLGKRMAAFVAGGVMISWATPPITAAIVFSWLFGTTGGLVNWVLGQPDYNWFASPLPTYTVLTVCVVWQSFPFIAVSVLARLE